jgi:hypothetical protein
MPPEDVEPAKPHQKIATKIFHLESQPDLTSKSLYFFLKKVFSVLLEKQRHIHVHPFLNSQWFQGQVLCEGRAEQRSAWAPEDYAAEGRPPYASYAPPGSHPGEATRSEIVCRDGSR